MGQKRRVLVVDDERDFLELIKERLEYNNYEVLTAESGKEALEKIGAYKPEVVFLDIIMPDIDGLGVLKKIRKSNKDLPIFILSAHSDKKHFMQAKKLGASGFIVKTDDLQSQIQEVSSVLNLAHQYKGRP
jgi:CheY-like chemotaxis protein